MFAAIGIFLAIDPLRLNNRLAELYQRLWGWSDNWNGRLALGGRIFAAIVGAFGLVLVCTALFDMIS